MILAPILTLGLAAAPVEDAAARVARILMEPAAKVDEAKVARALAQVGTDAVPVLVMCASGELFAVLPEGALEGGGGLAVRPDRIASVATEALAAMPPEPVVDAVAAYVATNRSLESRTAAARILSGVAAPAGIDVAFALLRGTGDEELRAPYVRGPLREAFAAPLRAHGGALGRVDRGLAELDPARTLLVVEALEAAERGDAADLVAALLRSEPELTRELLGVLGALFERRPFEAEARVDLGTLFAPYLADARTEVRAAAARAAGRSQAYEVAWALVERLADDAAEARASARSALRALAGVDHGYDVDAWGLAVETERRWRETDGFETDLAEVAGEDLSAAASALRRLAAHGLSRRAIGTELGGLRASLPEPTARTAAATLANLEARSAVPGLVQLLQRADEDETLRAAHAALTQLTGQDLPADAAAWRGWLERRGAP